MFTDKKLNCKECGTDFIFTESEQEFYAEKGFANEPGRCPTCRAARRNQNRNRGGRNKRKKEMHPAICDACGQEAQVPFKPTGDKPVYCQECFQKKSKTS